MTDPVYMCNTYFMFYIFVCYFRRDISDRTTVPTRTDRSLSLTVWDRRDPATRQVIQSGDPITLGRNIFFAICYNKGIPFVGRYIKDLSRDKILLNESWKMLLLKARLITFFRTNVIKFYLNSQRMSFFFFF